MGDILCEGDELTGRKLGNPGEKFGLKSRSVSACMGLMHVFIFWEGGGGGDPLPP